MKIEQNREIYHFVKKELKITILGKIWTKNGQMVTAKMSSFLIFIGLSHFVYKKITSCFVHPNRGSGHRVVISVDRVKKFCVSGGHWQKNRDGGK